MKLPLLLVLMCLAHIAHGEEPLARTDPLTWGKDGYLQFRWGMGPGDVAAALRAKDVPLTCETPPSLAVDTSAPADENYVCAPSAFEIASTDMKRVLFGFMRGRLFRVELNPMLPWTPWEKWREWTDEFRGLLTKKYGKPISEKDERAFVSATWVQGQAVAIHVISQRMRSSLIYTEPMASIEAVRAWQGRREAAERAAAKPALDKL